MNLSLLTDYTDRLKARGYLLLLSFIFRTARL